MRTLGCTQFAGLLLLTLWWVTPAVGGERVAVIIGANQGHQPEDLTLRYAQEDARALQEVLTNLGGFQKADVHLMLEPEADTITDKLAELSETLSNQSPEMFLFFYSGHAGLDGLHPGTSTLTGKNLREHLDRIPAKVHLSIIDACNSGALTQDKGGRPVAPFLSSTSNGAAEVTGKVWLMSAGPAEKAQEATEYGHSIFTYWLLSALRGAADTSGDGWVTLSETWEAVRSGTALSSTRTGLPQRPLWEISLRGSEDLRLTGLHRSDSGHAVLEFPAFGNYWVFASTGQLVTEVHALLPGHWISLRPGRYLVRRIEAGSHLREIVVNLKADQRRKVPPEEMAKVPYLRLARKGGRANAVRHAPLGLLNYHAATLNGFGPHLGGGLGWAFMVGRIWLKSEILFGQSAMKVANTNVRMAEGEATVKISYGFDWGRLVFRPQLGIGALVSHQQVESDSMDSYSRTNLGGLASAGFGFTLLPFSGPAIIDLDVDALGHFYRYQEADGDERLRLSPSFRLLLGFGYVL
jgi:hypothetical protein